VSTTSSFANFYVDSDGREQPIVFRAADLVNRTAPEGYHWERDNRAWQASREDWLNGGAERYRLALTIRDAEIEMLPIGFFSTPPYTDNYICVRDKEERA